MKNTRTPLLNALQELSYVCDLLTLDLPVVECNNEFIFRIITEYKQKHPNALAEDCYKMLYGIKFKVYNEVDEFDLHNKN